MLVPSFGNYFASQVYHTCQQTTRPHVSMSYASWVPRLFPSDKAYANYWKSRETCIRKLLNRHSITVKSRKNDTVMHFRCGDVPFSLHRIYRMPSINYLEFVVKHMKRRHVIRANIYWTLSHANDMTRYSGCVSMLQDIKKYFLSRGVYITIIDEKNAMKTLNIFGDANILVSLVPSSFAFSVGVVKGSNFISPFLGLSGIEGENTLDVVNKTRAKLMAKSLHWVMSTDESLAPGQLFKFNSSSDALVHSDP